MKKYDLGFDKCPHCNSLLAIYEEDTGEEIVEIGHCRKCDINFDNDKSEF